MHTILECDISNLSSLEDVAKKLISLADKNRIFLFEAPMGAGKTTFIKHCCKALGSNDHFSSPTYALVNEYTCPNSSIYHFDLYRLKNEEELMDLGVEEYLHSGAYCFVEWPAFMEPYIVGPFVKVTISVNGNYRYLRATQF